MKYVGDVLLIGVLSSPLQDSRTHRAFAQTSALAHRLQFHVSHFVFRACRTDVKAVLFVCMFVLF